MAKRTNLIERTRELTSRLTQRFGWTGPLLARVTVGTVFFEDGWGKVHHLANVAQYFGSLGIPHPLFNATLTAWTELLCGLLLFAGLATRLAAVPLIVVMLVAIRTAKWDDISGVGDFLSTDEFAYVVLFVWIAIAGPGLASVDHLLGRWWRRRNPPAAEDQPVRA